MGRVRAAGLLATLVVLAPIAVAGATGQAGSPVHPSVEASATFGQTSIGASSDSFAANRKRVSEYALPLAGTVSKLSIYLAPTATSGQQVLEGVIYSDASGKPGNLLGTTSQLTFESADAAGWYELTFSTPLSLAAGNYWIGVMTGATGGVAGFRYNSVSGSRDYNSNAYASGPSNPFGSVSTDSERMSLYATYAPSTPPPVPSNLTAPGITGTAQQGQTLTEVHGTWTNEPTSFKYQWLQCEALGSGCLPISGATEPTYVPLPGDVGHTIRVQETAINGGGSSEPATSNATAPIGQAPSTFGNTAVGASSDVFSAERKRVSRYELPVSGSITKLSIYLAPTATSGQQLLRGLIYSDSGGTPETLLGASEALTFNSTDAAGWYELTFPTPLSLAAGNYWIGVMSGATGGVAGFRYNSVSGSRDYNSNAYASGPSNPFGSVSTDSEQMSLYATYTSSAGGTPPSQTPTQPQGLRASPVSETQVDLFWEASSDEAGIAGYTIRRDGSVIANTGSTATSFSDTGLSPETLHTYTVEAYDSSGNRSTRSEAAGATTLAPPSVQHYEYVFDAKVIDVYDMDDGQKLVKTISLPSAANDIRGAAASPTTHMLYVSYGGDGGQNGGGSMLEYDLVNERVVWTHSYPEGVDSMAITPDGKTIYLPVGEESSASNWNVVEASTGNILGKIEGGKSPHNTIVSLNGEHVFMGGRNASYLTEADTSNNQIIKKIGPLLNGGVRPFTINGSETLAFTTATGFLGFQVSSITSGQVLYTVPIAGNFPYTPGQAGPSSPSHGISLSPDEKQVWVIDQPNSYVHVFDIAGLPSSPPVQIANIKTTRPMTGTQAGCTYDCMREGWLQHTLDGRYVYVGDSGDVIDTATFQSVANLEPLYNSRVFLEIDWQNGVPVATSTRSGLGYVK